MVDVKWASYGGWSGPWIKGARTYVPVQLPKQSTWEDVLLYAVAYPEGGTWDGFVAYDGTAATAGIFQWTLTSTRLQKLLEVCRTTAPTTYAKTVGALLTEWHLILKDGKICNESGTPLSNPSGLRAKFTPPDGKVPKSGTNWELAKRSALAFNGLFTDLELDLVQENFFLTELQAEAKLPRPKMNGASINYILYPNGWPLPDASAVFPDDAARALFWSCWQNSPRTAESYLYAANNEVSFKSDPLSFTIRLARKIAHSTFGNWGIEKAAENNREARYTKIVNCVNSQLICKLPQNP